MVLKSNEVVFLLGSNLGNRKDNLSKAIHFLKNQVGDSTKTSGIYTSKAWGYKSENEFYNQVVIAESVLAPLQILKITQTIEREMGREKKTNGTYSDRLVDIDILFYANQIFNTKDLIIPHPRIQERRFTLVPLFQLLPKFQHPVLGTSIEDLLRICPDNNPVKLLEIR
jgi:2-amino-4-hydroxy-6-hydroxymethyldihydropteridine diphosphokinase